MTWKIFSEFDSSGIKIHYTKSRKTIDVFGWYDRIVGIEGGEISLLDFIKQLEISVKDLKKVIKELENE